MASRLIHHRDAIEVFVNDRGFISMRQPDSMGNEDSIVEVHPDDVPLLIDYLNEAAREARKHAEDEGAG